MNLRVFPAPCIVAGTLYVLCPASALAQSATVAIQDVTVVDVADGSLQAGQTVLVEGNRIAAVKPVAEVDMPPDAVIVEGAGGYLVPGLWDMHVHATRRAEGRIESFFPLFLVNGVTGIRDTWGSLDVADSARTAVERAELAGPARVVVAGNLVDGPAPIWPGSQLALTPEDGRRIVDSLHAAGSPFVKVYMSLTRETYLAIAERSRELGMPFAGHVPIFVRAAVASDAGQRSVEHLNGVVTGCAAEEGAILAGYRRALRAHLAGDSTRSLMEILTEGHRRALATQVDARCRDLAARFVRNGTWQVPTLVTLRGQAYLRQLAAAGDERLRYLPPSIYEDDWFPESNRTAGGPWEDWRAMRQARYERKKEIVRLMAAAGVPFLAGSDTANPWAFPGFGLHDELELLVEAGMTPLQALRAATLNPARFFDRTDELGTVDEGKLADLVLLDANPLEDIGNTRRIRAVVADGRLYRRADLDRILAEVEAMHGESERQGPSGPSEPGSAARQAAQEVIPLAVPNDNRSPAGVRRDGALEIALVVTEARWYPEADSGPSEVVQAFAEEGEPPRIPGPLIRVPAGTEIRARVRNALAEDRVTLYGFHARPGSPDDSLHIDPGASRRVTFVAGEPGTYFYWGTTTGLAFDPEHQRKEDSQLHGALVVDPPGATGPPRDRVFVIGAWREPADSAGPPPIVSRDVMTINGKSWPHTERIHLTAGDTVRWRWLNPSVDAHPMHLHGFFFRVNSRGTWAADTLYRAGQNRMAVTELMLPGGTMTMEWVPQEPGNWLFHCHFSLHVSHFLSLEKVPDPADPLGPEAPDHTVEGMRGLILGITVEPGRSGERRPEVYGEEARRIRLLVQSAPGRYGEYEGLGYVVHEGGPAPPPDSVPTMSPPLVLRRGEPVNITVVNRLRAPTGVHWHGMELPSYPDGVPGWSGTPGRLAPPIAPGDSFVAAFTPPRAGTFIYHSHSNELAQIASGLFGPLIVVDPKEGYDPERERIFVVGGNGWVDFQGRVNGRLEPDTVRLTAGRTYRLRLININPDWRVYLSLKDGEEPLEWRALAKDGADLPPNQALRGRARILMGPGETADFAFTPERPGELAFEVTTQLEGWTVRVPIRVSSADGSAAAPAGEKDEGRTGDFMRLVEAKNMGERAKTLDAEFNAIAKRWEHYTITYKPGMSRR